LAFGPINCEAGGVLIIFVPIEVWRRELIKTYKAIITPVIKTYNENFENLSSIQKILTVHLLKFN